MTPDETRTTVTNLLRLARCHAGDLPFVVGLTAVIDTPDAAAFAAAAQRLHASTAHDRDERFKYITLVLHHACDAVLRGSPEALKHAAFYVRGFLAECAQAQFDAELREAHLLHEIGTSAVRASGSGVVPHDHPAAVAMRRAHLAATTRLRERVAEIVTVVAAVLAPTAS